MVKKHEYENQHYDSSEIVEELREWKKTEHDYFVVGTTAEEKRKPLKWKIEYETSPDKRAEMIALSRFVKQAIQYLTKF